MSTIECYCGKQVTQRHPSCARAHEAALGRGAAQGRAREEFDTARDIARMSQPQRDAILRKLPLTARRGQ